MARSAAQAGQQGAVIEVDEITLDGKRVVVRNQDLPVGDLRLDPKNPRIANTVSLQFGLKAVSLDGAIDELLWSDSDVHDLYKQVYVNGGLIERIIVRSNHVVAEGNCRVVVYRKLHEKFPHDRRWQYVPSRLLPEDILEQDIALLLGQMHVMGKNEWTPFEKAGHVYKLHKDYARTQDEIASRLRMSKSKVNQLIRAFEAMQNVFLKKYQGVAMVRKFSYFEELFKKPELRDWATADPENVRRFADWVGTEKISQGMHVRDLGKILKNRDAFAAFQDGGFEDARRVLEEDDPGLLSPLFKKMVETTALLREARLDDIQRASADGNRAAHQIVRDLEEALERFMMLTSAVHASGAAAESASPKRRRAAR
jgi:hypothetical protein